MTSNSEISQQINGVETSASPVRAGLGMNGTGTDSKSDTPLTRPRSGFDLEDTRRNLIAMREKHGADTPIGHRCSNLVEMLQNLAGCDFHTRFALEQSIRRSTAELAKLTSQ